MCTVYASLPSCIPQSFLLCVSFFFTPPYTLQTTPSDTARETENTPMGNIDTGREQK